MSDALDGGENRTHSLSLSAQGEPVDVQLRLRELEGQVAELRQACIRAQKDLLSDVPREDIVSYLRTVARDQGEQWDRDTVRDAIQRWSEKYGKPPSSASWSPSLLRDRGREEEVAQYLDGDRWPHSQTVRRVYGSWPAALAAAGFPPSPIGRPVGMERDRISEGLPEWPGWVRVGSLRLRGGMTVAELARRSSISYNHLRQLESGEQQNPTVRMLLALGKGLEVSPATLLEGAEGLRADILDAVEWAFRQDGAELIEESEQETTEEAARINALRWRLAQVAWDRSEGSS